MKLKTPLNPPKPFGKEAIKRFKIRSKEALILEDSKEGLKAARGSGGRVMKITNLRETNYKNIVNQILKY